MSNVQLKIVQFPEKVQGRFVIKRQKTAHAASPLKDAKTIKAMRAALADSGKYAKRNLAIFDFGVSSGRRCGDILSMQIFDVWDDLHGVLRKIEYRDQKTKTYKSFYLSSVAHANLTQYLEEAGFVVNGKLMVGKDTPLFPSRKRAPKSDPGSWYDPHYDKYRSRVTTPTGCLSVGTYRDILTKAALKHKITNIEHLGTHSMRKTFGYHGFRQNGAEFVQLALGHSSMNVTKNYIGIDDEYMKKKFNDLVIPGLDEEV